MGDFVRAAAFGASVGLLCGVGGVFGAWAGMEYLKLPEPQACVLGFFGGTAATGASLLAAGVAKVRRN